MSFNDTRNKEYFLKGNRFLLILRLHFKDATNQILYFFSSGAAAPSVPGPPNYRGFTITLRHTPHLVGLLWTGDQPHAETSTWQHTTLTRDGHLCPRGDSNPQSQQANGGWPTSLTARPLGSARNYNDLNMCYLYVVFPFIIYVTSLNPEISVWLLVCGLEETWVRFLSRKDSLQTGTGAHQSPSQTFQQPFLRDVKLPEL
jgi:hypothetical protein